MVKFIRIQQVGMANESKTYLPSFSKGVLSCAGPYTSAEKC